MRPWIPQACEALEKRLVALNTGVYYSDLPEFHNGPVTFFSCWFRKQFIDFATRHPWSLKPQMEWKNLI